MKDKNLEELKEEFKNKDVEELKNEIRNRMSESEEIEEEEDE